jgi:hypothetical protein
MVGEGHLPIQSGVVAVNAVVQRKNEQVQRNSLPTLPLLVVAQPSPAQFVQVLPPASDGAVLAAACC